MSTAGCCNIIVCLERFLESYNEIFCNGITEFVIKIYMHAAKIFEKRIHTKVKG